MLDFVAIIFEIIKLIFDTAAIQPTAGTIKQIPACQTHVFQHNISINIFIT